MRIPWPFCPGIDYISAPPEQSWRDARREIVILGATGSIGRNALDVIRREKGKFRVLALAGAKNCALLARQAEEFRPPHLAVLDETAAKELAALLPANYKAQIHVGPAGYASLASLPAANLILSAQAGSSGLIATVAAALAGKVIALANKESLVLAGPLLRKICAKGKAAILPVDSEHYALFQCLCGAGKPVKRLILTASGGPFRGMSAEKSKNMRAEAALRHPKWNMGPKISIDSSTLMNKGLEVMEAAQLFGLGKNKIHAIVHPQSIIHSMVEFEDNSLLAQLATPDMRLPIAAALMWPSCPKSPVAPLNLLHTGPLEFEELDLRAFPCFGLAMSVMDHVPLQGWQDLGINPASLILNSANEAAIELFLANHCAFGDIPELIADALAQVLPIINAQCPVCSINSDAAASALAIGNALAQASQAARQAVTSHCGLYPNPAPFPHN